MMSGNSCLSLATVSHHKRLPTLPMNTLQQHPRKDRIFHQHLLPRGHKSHNSAPLGWHSTEGPHLGDSKQMHMGKKKKKNKQEQPGDWFYVFVVWRQHLPIRKGLLQGPANRNDHNHTLEWWSFPPVISALMITKPSPSVRGKINQAHTPGPTSAEMHSGFRPH